MKKITILITLIAILGLLSSCTNTKKEPCALCGQLTTSTMAGGKTFLESTGIPPSKMKSVNSVVYSVYICDSCRGNLKTSLY